MGPMSIALFHLDDWSAIVSHSTDSALTTPVWHTPRMRRTVKLVDQLSISGMSEKAHISRTRRHDCKFVLVDDLLHLLYAAEVAKHVADRDNVPTLKE